MNMADDLDEFARLWREEPTPEESRALRQLADRAARRAKLLGYAEIGTGAIIALGILFALLIDPGPLTILSGGALLLGLLWTVRKRHLLRQVAILVGSGDGGSVVEKQIAKARVDLRRSRIGLFSFPPTLLLAHVMVNSVLRGGSLRDYGDLLARHFLAWPGGPLILLLFALAVGYQLRGISRLRAELRRLELIRAEYQEETRLDGLGDSSLTP
jgi:hypothetical protein